MLDLLTDPLIRVRLTHGEVRAFSLPELYAKIMRDQVVAFPALRPHQRHAWHAFLAQLGAVALHRAGRTDPPDDPDSWREMIEALTPEWAKHEPWQLVVEDVTKPGFLQPPVPAGSLSGFKSRVTVPDALDVLVTAKNHDLKARVATEAAPDDWLFALISLQTMAGYTGATNYGIARMNGGFSSRPCLGLAPDAGCGAHLRRDILGMLALRERILEEHEFYLDKGGIALLWTTPWDGTRALSLRELDPFFIEICRRVRLLADNGRLRAVTAGTECARIDARALNGRTGDFWTPVNGEHDAALAVGPSGFSYRQLARILFQFMPPPSLTNLPHDAGRMKLIARGVARVARSKGRTEGYHERSVPFSRRAALMIGSREGRDLLAATSEALVQDIRAATSALRAAIGIVASGGKLLSEISLEDRSAAVPFTRRLDAEVDAFFFAELWRRVEATEAGADAVAAAQRAFRERLVSLARSLLAEAAETVPCPAIRRPRARARAFRAFNGLTHHHFPDLHESVPEIAEHDNAA